MPFVFFGGCNNNGSGSSGSIDLTSVNKKISKNKNDINNIKSDIEQLKSNISQPTEKIDIKNIIDDSTIQLKDNKLVAKTLDGLEVIISELNQLKGIKNNIQEQINSLSKAINLKGKVDTHKDLLMLRNLENGDAYIIEKDEDENNSKTWYVWNNKEWICLGAIDINIRDFISNPIDLNTEVKGILPENNIDNKIARKSDLEDKLDKKDAYNPINKNVLDKLSENDKGDLLFNGEKIKGDNTTESDIDIEELKKEINNKLDKPSDLKDGFLTIDKKGLIDTKQLNSIDIFIDKSSFDGNLKNKDIDNVQKLAKEIDKINISNNSNILTGEEW